MATLSLRTAFACLVLVLAVTPNVSAAAQAAPSSLRADEVRSIRDRLVAETAAGRFSGAVLIAKDGRPLYQEAFGLADNDRKIPNTLDTQFRFGSIGKLFTEIAIMQLAQAGKIDVTASLGRYIPDYPNRDVAAKVTINELMTHSGGTGDEFGPVFDAHQSELLDPKDYIALFGSAPAQFPPGSRQEYSNFGMMILGRVIENASGLRYADYVERHIFRVAGMTSTGNVAESINLPKRSVRYMTVNGVLEPATVNATLRLRGTPAAHGYIPLKGGPDGGGYSTVGDFLRFAVALKANRLLDPEHTQLLLAGTAPMPTGDAYHYDMGGPLPGGGRFIGHAGAGPGQSAILRIFPDGYVVAVMANRDQPLAFELLDFIAGELPGTNHIPARPAR